MFVYELLTGQQTLWGGWCITGHKDNQSNGDQRGSRLEIDGKKVFFAGDTGYCEKLFKEIGKIFGGFDCAAIPIGAYCPRWVHYSFQYYTI